jgi:hypothetical protein
MPKVRRQRQGREEDILRVREENACALQQSGSYPIKQVFGQWKKVIRLAWLHWQQGLLMEIVTGNRLAQKLLLEGYRSKATGRR